MKVAVFCAYFYPHKGGMEKYAQELFSGLKDIGKDRKDVDVSIITTNSEHVSRFEKKFGLNIYRFQCWNLMGQMYPIIKPTEHKNIEKIIKEGKFDYIITHTRFFSTSFLGCKIAKKFKIPLIHFEHGTNHSPIKNPILNLFGKFYDHTIGKYIIKNSYKVVGISKASEEFVKHLYSVNPKKIICIYNSIDTKKFSRTSSSEQHRTKAKLKIKNEKVIVFVGRIIFAKGIQDLLEGLKTVKDIEKIKVIIIGDGNYLDELKKNYPWAIFLGQKEPDKITEYLSIADIFVNPSYAEGLPTSVLEAGSVGVPIIATDVGGTKEIIDNGKNGFLVKPKDIGELRDKIGELLYNEKLRRKFSRNIKEKIRKEFDWEISKKKLYNVLK